MRLKTIIKESHENAITKGFYDCPECGGVGYREDCGSLVILKDDYSKCPSCNGTGITTTKNIPELLMLVVTEIGESVEALRENKKANWENYETDLDFQSDFIPADQRQKKSFERWIKNSFEDEIADVFIRLADLCGYMNIDIEKHIELKMEYNRTRPKKHGKEF